MIRFGGRSVRGFGFDARPTHGLGGPTIRELEIATIPVLVGTGVGLGTTAIGYRLKASPWEAIAAGVGTAVMVGGITRRFMQSSNDSDETSGPSMDHANPEPKRLMISRGNQIMTTPGNFVSEVQQALTNAGFDTQGTDNKWGPHTSMAASAFQAARGMTPTGLPEPELLQALGVAVPSYPEATDIANALASSLGGIVEPRDAVKVMLNESGLDPTAVNRQNGEPVAAGVFQLLVSQIPTETGMSFDEWIKLSAAQQIPYAAKSWRDKATSNGTSTPISARDLYWLNYLPATYVPGASDDYQFVRSDDTYLPRGGDWTHAAGFYTQNTGLDHGNKGYITAGDMVLAAAGGAMNNPTKYAAIVGALVPQSVA
jgi:hypothetical protein